VETGTLGYVRHTYNPRNLYHQLGNFFIALGPVFTGGLVLYAAARLLLGDSTFHITFDAASGIGSLEDIPPALLAWLDHMVRVLANFFVLLDLTSWRAFLFIYVVLAVGSHVNLSPADLVAGRTGFAVISVLLFATNALLMIFVEVPLQVFHLPGRYLGLASSVVVACTGVMVPLLVLLEIGGRIMDSRRRPERVRKGSRRKRR